MSIVVSSIQSFEYAKHWGDAKAYSLIEGVGLSASSSITGRLRSISDNFTMSEPSTETAVVFGWIFSADALIMSGTFSCVVPQTPLSISFGAIFDGVTAESSQKTVVFPDIYTNTVNSTDELKDKRPISVNKGNAFGIEFTHPMPAGVQVDYSIIYMSNL